MSAPRYSTSEVVSVLLDAGAEVNARDKSGRTALSAANENPYRDDMIKLLERRGAKE
jgi:ankyrin repeat protein